MTDRPAVRPLLLIHRREFLWGWLLAVALLLAGCATDETQFEPEATLEEPSFLLDGATGATDAPSPLPERDYSSIEFVGWNRHPGDAMKEARSQGRPLLILFTALSWSENARKLGDEVFLSRTFNDLARDQFVLAFLDYPQSLNDAPRSMQMMKERYRIKGYPTIVLLDHDGKELWRRSGYVPGKAQDYFGELEAAMNRLKWPTD